MININILRNGKLIAMATAGLLMGYATSGLGQTVTPIGVWRTVDDSTRRETSLISLSLKDGKLIGTIEKLFPPSSPTATCDLCTDYRKGQPIVGMTILDGVRKADGEETWGGGYILDPRSGKSYTVQLKLLENGQRLEVRGYRGPFFRTQAWNRVE